jgi:glycosyltransferase involved in cell wall biosynthesis
MINRSDAYKVSGGDVIQLEKTASSVAEFGVHVTTRLVNQLEDDDGGYDLVHVFNIQSAKESQQAVEWAHARGLPVALSPIYWDPLPAWFGDNDSLRPFWRVVKRLLGYHLGLQIYSGWQRGRSTTQGQVQRELLLDADVVLPNSHAEARVLAHDFGLPEQWSQSVLIVPNAIDGLLFCEEARHPSAILDTVGRQEYVLEVGRVSPEKNNLGLLEALWDVDVPIVFVGQPSPYHADYVAACQTRALERGNVHFIHWMPHDELPAVYRSASVHVLPSWRETPGLVSLEAAAAGCRVVSTTIGSAYEYFGELASYCHPASKRSIRRAVLAALKTPRTGLLQQHVLSNFTWNKAAQKTLVAYKLVLTCRATIDQRNSSLYR